MPKTWTSNCYKNFDYNYNNYTCKIGTIKQSKKTWLKASWNRCNFSRRRNVTYYVGPITAAVDASLFVK